MATNQPDASFWSNRYADGNTPWNIGAASRPLIEYFDQLEDKSGRILIPGAGYGYEAEYLFRNGFINTYLSDIASEPLQEFQKRCPEFPKNQIIQDDFFTIQGAFDLIVEQTFFCALPPVMRTEYTSKMRNLLSETGKLVGLLFNFPLTEDGPPYGGNLELYKELFSTQFRIKVLSPCYNSIPPRDGHEYFIHLIPK